MKLFENIHIFNHSWVKVTTAHWVKYSASSSTTKNKDVNLLKSTPSFFSEGSHREETAGSGITTSLTPHITAVDILERNFDPSTQILTTYRLIACKQSGPSFLRRWLSDCPADNDNVGYVLEISRTDPRNRILELTSTNLSMSHLFVIEENLTYSPSNVTIQSTNEDTSNHSHNTTQMKQEVKVTSFNLTNWLTNAAEEFVMSRFQANASKGRVVMEQILDTFQSHVNVGGGGGGIDEKESSINVSTM